MSFYVYYLLVEDETLPFYVGKSFVGSRRINEHKCHSRGGKTIKDRKIQKALREGKRIIEKVISTIDTEDEAHAIERSLIALHGRRNLGTGFLTNLTDGGEGVSGQVHSDETRKRMSEAKKGNKINIGRKRPDMVEMFSKEITAFDHDGVPVGTFSSAREAEKELGIHFSVISMILKGRDGAKFGKNKETGLIYHFRYGIINEKVYIPPYRHRTSPYWVVQYNKEGKEIARFSTIQEAGVLTGIKGIPACVQGKTKTSGGYVWKKEYKQQGVC